MGARAAAAMMPMAEPRSTQVDVAFALSGATLPRDHRWLLAEALKQALPRLADLPGAGVHGIKVAPAAATGASLLPRRTRLLLRVPRAAVAALDALVGARLDIGGHALRLGEVAMPRELQPHRTLYAHLVAAEDAAELAFLAAVDAELAALGVACRPICGRAQTIDAGGRPLTAYSLMLDGLADADALRLLDAGLGRHRLLGCGLFVPHRSTAAVGS